MLVGNCIDPRGSMVIAWMVISRPASMAGVEGVRNFVVFIIHILRIHWWCVCIDDPWIELLVSYQIESQIITDLGSPAMVLTDLVEQLAALLGAVRREMLLQSTDFLRGVIYLLLLLLLLFIVY